MRSSGWCVRYPGRPETDLLSSKMKILNLLFRNSRKAGGGWHQYFGINKGDEGEGRMAKIKVTRKSYVRKDGTEVKGATYYTQDIGKPGKTPEREKFFDPKVKMNWHKDLSEETRRKNALDAHGGSVLATARALQELSNVTTDAETKRLTKIDADYFFSRR